MNIVLRPANEGDINFLLSTWLKSYYTHGNAFRKPKGEIYYKEHQSLIKAKLNNSTVTIATTSDDETQIIGYLVAEGDCVHYLYVKNLFRGFKIAKKLLGTFVDGPKEYSHHTSYSDEVNRGMIYNPYSFYK